MMERPTEVIKRLHEADTSKLLTALISQDVEVLRVYIAALEEVERLSRAVMDASYLDTSDGHAPNPAITYEAYDQWKALCKLLGVWDEERE
jgi:hypothetical protein